MFSKRIVVAQRSSHLGERDEAWKPPRHEFSSVACCEPVVGAGQRFCIFRCRRSCTVRPGRGRTRNRPLARSNAYLLVAGRHSKAKIGLVHDRPPVRALRTMLITAEGRVVHQLDESYTSFLTWHPKWSWCCQAREGPLRDSRVRRRAGVAAPMGTTRSDGATAMKREAGESTANKVGVRRHLLQ